MLHFFIYHLSLLFNDKFSILESSLQKLEHVKMDVVHGEIYDTRKIEITHQDRCASTKNSVDYYITDYTYGMKRKLRFYRVISLDETIEYLYNLSLDVDVLVLLIERNYYLNCTEIMEKMMKRRNKAVLVLAMDTTNSRLMYSALMDSIGGNTSYRLQLRVYRGIERVFIVAFYFLLTVLIVLCFITLQIWLRNQTTKNPLITPYELNRCIVDKYGKLNGSNRPFESCLICMDEFTNESVCRVLRCNHNFHKECVDPWLKTKSSRCPYCRELIKVHEDDY
ncbi:ubiquitin---protein ligase [Trachipleistophora hominis]|uniref:Ubiquitin---protein ligase n=1 Tax=Trachipleistophora hominis TaxID=72359 RepID=L7JZV4_TRAHO|nr:ubiquitin---protein ligase [Trachipleistophora hominis]